MTTSAEDAAALRQVLLSLTSPTVDLEEVYTRLTEAHSAGCRTIDMAHCIPNDIERQMEETLRVYNAAADMAERYTEVINIITSLENAWLSTREKAEAALCDAMHASGAPEIIADGMKAALGRQTQRVIIEDIDLLPLDVFNPVKPPKPSPSLDKIRAKLTTSQPCPGAKLIDAEPKINIKSTVSIKNTNFKGRAAAKR